MVENTALSAGARIGNYRIEVELECDGLGVTFRGVHQVLPRRSIIKVMHATSQTRVGHTLREACMLDALQHPGVPRVYESGLLPDRRPWFAFELIEGGTLEAVMTPPRVRASKPKMVWPVRPLDPADPAPPTQPIRPIRKPQPAEPIKPKAMERLEAIGLLRDVAGVLEHAHHRGIIHCGLRPSRILLTGSSRSYPVCISDWSDARTHDASPQPYIMTPASWAYTAPELSRGDTIDDRADVFALGVIAYQLLAGTAPFEGRVTDSTTAPVPLDVLCPDLPDELTTLVDQMLAVERWDRPSSAEVHAELAWIAEALSTSTSTSRAQFRIRRPRWTPPLEWDGDLRKLEHKPTARDVISKKK
jgi:eukaryotic-like serine/threonine-protein kinase